MEKVILIRFGEIFLKGNNKNYFESVLKKNIKQALKEYEYDFVFSQNRYYIQNYKLEDESQIIDLLLSVFGLHSISVAYKVISTVDNIKEAVDKIVPIVGSFKVITNRADKKFEINSMELSRQLGSCILEKYPILTVDVFEPQSTINVDIRETGYTYVYSKKLLASGGMPVGTSGKGLILLSGGIDSPVAAYMMAKRGMRLSAIHFHSFPYTSQLALDKVINLSYIVSKYCLSIDLYVVNFTKIQEEIHNKCPEELMITIMRRMMMRIACKLANRIGSQAIVTGESLGQVASQTVESMTCTNALATYPVFRPLIGMDKQEIMNIARKIGTYETSIEPHQDCCTVFLPKNPAIRPKLDYVAKCEEVLDVDNLVQEAVDTIEIIKRK